VTPSAYLLPQTVLCGPCLQRGKKQELVFQVRVRDLPEFIGGTVQNVPKVIYGFTCPQTDCENNRVVLSAESCAVYIQQAAPVVIVQPKEP